MDLSQAVIIIDNFVAHAKWEGTGAQTAAVFQAVHELRLAHPTPQEELAAKEAAAEPKATGRATPKGTKPAASKGRSRAR